jgi:hypothetical protein
MRPPAGGRIENGPGLFARPRGPPRHPRRRRPNEPETGADRPATLPGSEAAEVPKLRHGPARRWKSLPDSGPHTGPASSNSDRAQRGPTLMPEEPNFGCVIGLLRGSRRRPGARQTARRAACPFPADLSALMRLELGGVGDVRWQVGLPRRSRVVRTRAHSPARPELFPLEPPPAG